MSCLWYKQYVTVYDARRLLASAGCNSPNTCDEDIVTAMFILGNAATCISGVTSNLTINDVLKLFKSENTNEEPRHYLLTSAMCAASVLYNKAQYSNDKSVGSFEKSVRTITDGWTVPDELGINNSCISYIFIRYFLYKQYKHVSIENIAKMVYDPTDRNLSLSVANDDNGKWSTFYLLRGLLFGSEWFEKFMCGEPEDIPNPIGKLSKYIEVKSTTPWYSTAVTPYDAENFRKKLIKSNDSILDSDIVMCAYILGNIKSYNPKVDIVGIGVNDAMSVCREMEQAGMNAMPLSVLLGYLYKDIISNSDSVMRPKEIDGAVNDTIQNLTVASVQLVHAQRIAEYLGIEVGTSFDKSWYYVLYKTFGNLIGGEIDEVVCDMDCENPELMLVRSVLMTSKGLFRIMSGEKLLRLVRNDEQGEHTYSYEMYDHIDSKQLAVIRDVVDADMDKFYKEHAVSGLSTNDKLYYYIYTKWLAGRGLSDAVKDWVLSVVESNKSGLSRFANVDELVQKVPEYLANFNESLPSMLRGKLSPTGLAITNVYYSVLREQLVGCNTHLLSPMLLSESDIDTLQGCYNVDSFLQKASQAIDKFLQVYCGGVLKDSVPQALVLYVYVCGSQKDKVML